MDILYITTRNVKLWIWRQKRIIKSWLDKKYESKAMLNLVRRMKFHIYKKEFAIPYVRKDLKNLCCTGEALLHHVVLHDTLTNSIVSDYRDHVQKAKLSDMQKTFSSLSKHIMQHGTKFHVHTKTLLKSLLCCSCCSLH